MPSIGDKYIFTIDRIYSSKKHAESRYGFKGFRNFVLDKDKIKQLLLHGNIRKLEEATEEEYQTGYDQGFSDGLKRGREQTADYKWNPEEAYQYGLDEAWWAARRIFAVMDIDEIDEVFGEPAAEDNEVVFTYSAREAIQKIKEHDEQKKAKPKINRDKFLEVFGFLPGYEVMEDGRIHFPCFENGFWGEEYKEPEKEE